MIFGSIIKGAASIAGGLLGGAAENKNLKNAAQAAEFNPYDVTSSLGTATFDRKNNTVETSLNPMFSGINQQLGGLAGSILGQNQPFHNFASAVGNQIFPQTFGNAMGALGQMPGAGEMGQLGAMRDQTFGLGQGFLDASTQNPFMAQTGLLTGMGNQFAGNLQSNAQFAQQDAFNRLNELARPGEERLVNQTFNRLANTGRLGFTQADSGTNPTLRSMFAGLGDAQTNRGLQAQNFGINQRASDVGAMNSLFGQGQGFFGQGLNQQQLFGNLGMGMSGMSANLNNQMFGRDLTLNNLGAQRALQQMQLAQGTFGFGQDVQGGQIGNALSALGGSQSLGQNELDLARLGGNIGGQQAAAGANAAEHLAGRQSTLGGSLAGLSGVVNPEFKLGDSLGSIFKFG